MTSDRTAAGRRDDSFAGETTQLSKSLQSEGFPKTSLGEMRRLIVAFMNQGYLDTRMACDVLVLINLAQIVKKRRARFAELQQTDKSHEEVAMDKLLEAFDD